MINIESVYYCFVYFYMKLCVPLHGGLRSQLLDQSLLSCHDTDAYYKILKSENIGMGHRMLIRPVS